MASTSLPMRSDVEHVVDDGGRGNQLNPERHVGFFRAGLDVDDTQVLVAAGHERMLTHDRRRSINLPLRFVLPDLRAVGAFRQYRLLSCEVNSTLSS